MLKLSNTLHRRGLYNSAHEHTTMECFGWLTPWLTEFVREVQVWASAPVDGLSTSTLEQAESCVMCSAMHAVALWSLTLKLSGAVVHRTARD